MEKDKLAASDVLESVVNKNTADRITFYEIKASLHERGFGILMVIFILPVAIPFPYPPGVPTLLVIPAFIFSIQMMLGVDAPWLPKWLERKSIDRKTLAKIIEKGAPMLRKIEKLMRPRLSFVSSPKGERLIGLFSFIFGVSIVLPIPFSNLVPAIGVLIMSLGLLSKDGVTVILGIIIGNVGLLFTTLVVIYGAKAILAIFPWFNHIY